jgi:hypothetical protein
LGIRLPSLDFCEVWSGSSLGDIVRHREHHAKGQRAEVSGAIGREDCC